MSDGRRTAMITGGAQGIGRGCVEHFLEAGWQVAALDKDAEAVADLAGKGGRQLFALVADVTDEAAVADAFGQIARWTGDGGPDLLFNNAGVAGAETGPIEELSLAEWRRRIDASLTGTFLCTRAAVPALRRRRGAIVNMASTRAFQSEPHCEAYAAAKGGVVALTMPWRSASDRRSA